MRAMILAAGRGERMGALTDRVPKPLLEVDGEPLIVRHIRALAAAGIDDLVVNLSYRGLQIRDCLGNGSAWNVRIRYSEEGEPALETAGGIVHALPLLGDQPFAVVSSDVVCDFDFALLHTAVPRSGFGPGSVAGPGSGSATGEAASRHWSGTLIMVDNPAHHRQGDFALASDGLLAPAPASASASASASVSSPSPSPGRARCLTYAGIGVFDPALFAALPAGRRPLRPVLLQTMARGTLYGQRFDGLWVDAGTPERLEEARAALAEAEQ